MKVKNFFFLKKGKIDNHFYGLVKIGIFHLVASLQAFSYEKY